jgi:hypothetical protein
MAKVPERDNLALHAPIDPADARQFPCIFAGADGVTTSGPLG